MGDGLLHLRGPDTMPFTGSPEANQWALQASRISLILSHCHVGLSLSEENEGIPVRHVLHHTANLTWVWLKMKDPGLRRF